jgi:hypothetical protein
MVTGPPISTRCAQEAPAAEEVALQPPFQGVLAEHLHDAPVRGQVAAVGVLREVLAEPRLLGDLVHSVEPVGKPLG